MSIYAFAPSLARHRHLTKHLGNICKKRCCSVMTTEAPLSNNLSVRSALRYFRAIMPPLDGTAHKGQSGRICVLGGSPEYTGAPYFAAISTLRTGADLAYVVTNGNSSAAAIKANAPDLIVYPSLDAVFDLLPRAHALVIGPGLGRSDIIPETIEKLLKHPDALKIPIVLDADALYFVANTKSICDLIINRKSSSPPIVLTPNVAEFDRLSAALQIEVGNHEQVVSCLGEEVIVLAKGKTDRVIRAHGRVEVDVPASLKRVGGQGDILAGMTAVALTWSHLRSHQNPIRKAQFDAEKSTGELDWEMAEAHGAELAVAAASALTRECSRRAFAKHGRALLTSDILLEIGSVMRDLEFGNLIEEAAPN